MDHQKFNKLAEYVKDTTTFAAKKSSNLLELSKLTLETKNLGKNLKVVYIELGELFYKANKDNKDKAENYRDYFNNVEETSKKIEHLNKKILKLKDMRLCKLCNKEISKNSVFCPACGGKL